MDPEIIGSDRISRICKECRENFTIHRAFDILHLFLFLFNFKLWILTCTLYRVYLIDMRIFKGVNLHESSNSLLYKLWLKCHYFFSFILQQLQ